MRTDQPANDDRLVEAYLRNYLTRDDSLLWAFSEVNDITRKDTERGWRLTLVLIAEKALGYVAAGPLDEMLEVHGDCIIDRVEELSRSDKRFRHALSLVGCFEDSMPERIRSRINRALGRI
jgi:Family of unknown function (DUF6869)